MFVTKLCFSDISDQVHGFEGQLKEVVREIKGARSDALALFESSKYDIKTHINIAEKEGRLRALSASIEEIKTHKRGCCKNIRKAMQVTLYGSAGLYLAAEGVNAYIDVYDECHVPALIAVVRKVILASCASMAAGYTYLSAQEDLRARAEAMIEVIDEQIWNNKMFKKLHITATYPEKIRELSHLIASGKGDGRSRSLLAKLVELCPDADHLECATSPKAKGHAVRSRSMITSFSEKSSERLMPDSRKKERAKLAYQMSIDGRAMPLPGAVEQEMVELSVLQTAGRAHQEEEV
jgi:hypothetical protein